MINFGADKNETNRVIILQRPFRLFKKAQLCHDNSGRLIRAILQSEKLENRAEKDIYIELSKVKNIVQDKFKFKFNLKTQRGENERVAYAYAYGMYNFEQMKFGEDISRSYDEDIAPITMRLWVDHNGVMNLEITTWCLCKDEESLCEQFRGVEKERIDLSDGEGMEVL